MAETPDRPQRSGRPRATAMSPAVVAEAQAAVLCWLATVDGEGQPNVSPKEIFAPLGSDRLVIADIASARSVANIQANPSVCVSFIDVFTQKGFKLIGTARIIGPQDEAFAIDGAEILAMAGPHYHVRHIMAVSIGRIERIWAPSYALFPDRSLQERMAPVYARYGVLKAGD